MSTDGAEVPGANHQAPNQVFTVRGAVRVAEAEVRKLSRRPPDLEADVG